MSVQLVVTIVLAVLGILVSVGTAVVGYFVHRLDRRLEDHDEADERRFDKLTSAVDALKEDTVAKRHSFRAEMREAFANVHDQMERQEDKLRAEIKERK